MINTQRLFTANLAIKLAVLLLGEEIIDLVSTQLVLASGGYEGNPLLATFNQAHSVLQFSLVGKFVFPLLLFPTIYFVFFKINDETKLGRFIHRFLIASIFATNILFIIVLSWNISLLMKI